MNTPVNFEIAKLLKEKGFDKRVKGFYDTEKELHENYVDEMNTKGFANRHLPKGEYSAPTIAEVVMWLYEKYGIWIWIEKNSFIGGGKSSFISNVERTEYNSPTEAYEAAITYVLTKLI